jgi:ribosome-associated protein
MVQPVMNSKEKQLEARNLVSEAIFSTSRSSGPGGQNVNKVNTKVELRFNVEASILLTGYEKSILKSFLKSQLTIENELILTSQEERSQLKNKETVVRKFYKVLGQALTPRKKRFPTKPTFASKLRRLETKRLKSLNKKLRKEDF